MSQRSGFVLLGTEQLHCRMIGMGRRILLAFHGYGNNALMFTSLEDHLGREFTILCFDLPHHGHTEWNPDVKLEKEDMETLVRFVLKTFKVDKVSLLGYSMGGRVCLCVTEQLPEAIEQVLLIASDGLVFNRFYHFVTRTHLGSRLFKGFLTQPDKYIKYIDWLHERKWIDPSRYRFAQQYTGAEYQRAFLLKVWPGLSQLVPDQKRLKRTINKHRIPVYVFMGQHDRIIPPAHGKRFVKGVETAQLFILDKGHRVMDQGSLPQMAQCLLSSC